MKDGKSVTEERRMWSTSPEILSIGQRLALTMGWPGGGLIGYGSWVANIIVGFCVFLKPDNLLPWGIRIHILVQVRQLICKLVIVDMGWIRCQLSVSTHVRKLPKSFWDISSSILNYCFAPFVRRFYDNFRVGGLGLQGWTLIFGEVMAAEKGRWEMYIHHVKLICRKSWEQFGSHFWDQKSFALWICNGQRVLGQIERLMVTIQI